MGGILVLSLGLSLPAFQEWTRDGLAETLVIDRFELV